MNKKIEFVRKIGDYFIFYEDDDANYIIYYDLPENDIKDVECNPHHYYNYIVCKIYDYESIKLDLEGFIQELDRNFVQALQKVNEHNQNA